MVPVRCDRFPKGDGRPVYTLIAAPPACPGPDGPGEPDLAKSALMLAAAAGKMGSCRRWKTSWWIRRRTG